MSLVSDLYDQVSRLEAERDKLKAELALAMKVPSVAAMHSYLDTVCAKQNVQFAAERDTLRAQVEAMRADADLYRQWFNAVQDLNPSYLERSDYQAAVRLLKALGQRVPSSVSDAALQFKQ